MAFDASINIWGGDHPVLSVEVKGVSSYITFSNRLEFFRPTSTHATLPGFTLEDIENSGIDVGVRPWSWWIVLDNITELSCVFRGGSDHGPGNGQFRIYDGNIGSCIEIMLTEDEAELIYSKVSAAIGEHLQAGRKGILRPAYSTLEYPVKSYIFVHTGEPAISPSPHRSRFMPDA